MLRRISDFVLEGPGVWYDVEDDGTLIFYDGPYDNPDTTMQLEHFRQIFNSIEVKYIEESGNKQYFPTLRGQCYKFEGSNSCVQGDNTGS